MNAKHLVAHGGAINQLKCPVHKPYLLASASMDQSIRLWNINTMVCIATFHGILGHRDEIVTIDFNRNCSQLVSGGMDHVIVVWDLTRKSVATAIVDSCKFDVNKQETHEFKTVVESYPIFRSRRIHVNYIDCVQWMHKHILSKVNKIIYLLLLGWFMCLLFLSLFLGTVKCWRFILLGTRV